MMSSSARLVFLLIGIPLPTHAAVFLGGDVRATRLREDLFEFHSALEGALSCGDTGTAESVRRAQLEEVLAPLWVTLPQDQHGRVEWRVLRYVVHRLFVSRWNMIVRVLEPSQNVSASQRRMADLLNSSVPGIAGKLLNGSYHHHSFTLKDAAAMAFVLEHVATHEDGERLEVVYKHQHRSLESRLSEADLWRVMEEYTVRWITGSDMESLEVFLRDMSAFEWSFPIWPEVREFLGGLIRGQDWSQSRLVLRSQRSYSFEDARQLTASLTKKFGSFWDTHCRETKALLMAKDRPGRGRISLADFYRANKDGDWQFAESKAYLEEIGALEDSSGGSRLLIANYVQGPSNCIEGEHYHICCASECESILGDIEEAVRAPMANPADILNVVSFMSDFSDQRVKLSDALLAQLGRVAELHGGKVALHSRLFRQWLHHAFPYECPFPRRAGEASASGMSEFGKAATASQDEVKLHAENMTIGEMRMEEESATWLEVEEEEVLMDYEALLRPSFLPRKGLALSALVVAVWTGSLALWHGPAVSKDFWSERRSPGVEAELYRAYRV